MGEIALLLGEAAQMETTYRRVVGIILVPQQPIGGELVEIVGVDRVGAFPVEQDELIADLPDRVPPNACCSFASETSVCRNVILFIASQWR